METTTLAPLEPFSRSVRDRTPTAGFIAAPLFITDLADETAMTLFGTSAKYIDSVAKAGLEPMKTHALTALRTMTTTTSTT